jgi:hypothetical protein
MKIAIEYKQLHPRSICMIKLAPKDAVAVAVAAAALAVAEYSTPLPDSQPHYKAAVVVAVVDGTDKELFELQEPADTQVVVVAAYAVIPTLLPGIEAR